MKNKSWLYTLMALAFILIITSNCKKDDDNKPDGPTLTAYKNTVNQLEVVALRCKNITHNSTSYTGTIGGNSVYIKVISDTLLVFLMPENILGSQTLVLNIDSKEYSILFNVIQIPQISDPVQYLYDFITQFTFNLPNEPAFNALSDSLAIANLQFNDLTPEQQQQAVAFIAANRAPLDEVNSLLNDHLKKSGKAICPDDLNTIYMKCMVADFTVCIIKLAIPVVGLSLIGSVFTPAGTFIGGMLGFIIDRFVLKSLWLRTGDLWSQICDKTFEAIKVSFESKKSTSFNNNEAKNIVVQLEITNIQNKEYSQPWLRNLMFNFNMFKTFWNELFGIENVPDYSTEVHEVGYADYFGYLSLRIIENSNNVTGRLGGTIDNLNATFSTIQTSYQDFTFCIVYGDGYFNVESPIVSAKVLVSAAYSIAKVSGDNQTGTLGQALTNPIIVIVKDEQNNPCSGINVFITANNGGSVSQTQVTTGVDGTASVSWTLGSTDATQTITVRAYKNDNITPLYGSPISFTATTAGCSTFMVGGYEAVQIGTQVWMAKNLNIATTNSCCYNDDAAMCAIYGRLYTWNDALTACPGGWHLPSDAEWTQLTNYLGGESVAGGKLKSTSGWGNTGVTNETCFTALPGGERENVLFGYVGSYGFWWSSTENDTSHGWCRMMFSINNEVSRARSLNISALSVRCLRD